MLAVWAEERDIANPETIIAIADEQGFDGKVLFDSTGQSQVQEELDRNTKEALARNVFGPLPGYTKKSCFGVRTGLIFWPAPSSEINNFSTTPGHVTMNH